MRRTALTLVTLAAAAGTAGAQVVRLPQGGAMARVMRDDDRAMLGISTSPGGMRDTLGLLVSSVTAKGPADKAGIQEGDRLQSINGVSLKLRADDAGDRYMQGINQNRLTREMRKVKPGDDVTLEVYSGGRSRTVKVAAASAAEVDRLATTGARSFSIRDDDRAVLGVYLGALGTTRDTAGVFIQQVVAGGPAEKAGVVEGDRVASINGVDLRVAREDAGDVNAASSRVDRMEREVEKLKAGDVAELVVVSGGRSRTVRVTAAKASDVPGMDGFAFSGPDGTVRTFTIPGGRGSVIVGPNGGGTIRAMPRIELRRGMDDDIRAQIEDNLQGLRDRMQDLRATLRARGGAIGMSR